MVAPWLGGSQAEEFGTGNVVPASLWWLLVPAALLVGGWIAARRSGRRADRLLVELATVATVASVVTLSRVTVAPYHFVFYWRIAVAVFVVAASVWALGHALPERVRTAPPVRRAAAGVLAVVLGIASLAQVADVVNGNDGFRHEEDAVAVAMTQVEAAGLPSRTGPGARARQHHRGLRPGRDRRARPSGRAGAGRPAVRLPLRHATHRDEVGGRRGLVRRRGGPLRQSTPRYQVLAKSPR